MMKPPITDWRSTVGSRESCMPYRRVMRPNGSSTVLFQHIEGARTISLLDLLLPEVFRRILCRLHPVLRGTLTLVKFGGV